MKIRKKLLALVLVAATTFLTACGGGSDKTYAPGKFTDNGYESEFLGFRYTTPEGYTLSDEETLQSLMGLTLDAMGDDLSEIQKKYAEIAVVYEMMVASDTGTANANITLEKTNAKLSTYIDTFKTQASELSGMDVTLGDTQEEVTLAGATYTKLTGSVDMSGITINQEYYLRKVGDRMMALTVTWYDDEAERDTLLNGFAAY